MNLKDTSLDAALRRMCGGLVVSCQAPPGSPLRTPSIMAAMARAAEMGGASGIRANGAADVRAILDAVSLPVMGLSKVDYPGSPVYITPTIVDIDALLDAGCRLIALDATNRSRPDGVTLRALVDHIHSAGALAFGDIATTDDIDGALDAGVDAIGTTLSGYTGTTAAPPGPDLELVRELAQRSPVPVYAEGRYRSASQVAEARSLGASFVVIGGAITDPITITRTLAQPFAEENTPQ